MEEAPMPNELKSQGAADRLMDTMAIDSLIEGFAGKNVSAENREYLAEEVRGVAEYLAGLNPTPAEALLAECAARAWFVLRDAEFRRGKGARRNQTIAQAEFADRRLDRAQARFNRIIKTLAAVRKLAAPAIQVNVAERQVNISGAVDLTHRSG